MPNPKTELHPDLKLLDHIMQLEYENKLMREVVSAAKELNEVRHKWAAGTIAMTKLHDSQNKLFDALSKLEDE